MTFWDPPGHLTLQSRWACCHSVAQELKGEPPAATRLSQIAAGVSHHRHSRALHDNIYYNTNTFFKHPDAHTATWLSPGGRY